MKRALPIFITLLLVLALTLAGCGRAALLMEERDVIQNIPGKETAKELQFGSLTVNSDAESLDLSGSGAGPEELMRAKGELKRVKEIRLGVTEAAIEQLRALEAAFPQAQISWSARIFGEEIDCRAQSLSLPGATDADTEQIVSALALLPELKTIELAPEDGLTELSFDSLDAIAAAAPEAELNCRFELFGQRADWLTEKLKYERADVGNEGIDVFRRALPYLRSLTLLRLENCGIDDHDKMDALRGDFPDKGVVWSVPVGNYIIMTDTTLLNDGDIHILNDENVGALRYMHEVLYLDFGHSPHLTNMEFVRNFPKLQVLIMTLSQVGDLSPLENCPDLEFLECHSTPIADLSVLADKTKLEYLNIANMPNLTDLSPLYGLKQLKIVRICGSTRTHISQADLDALRAELPDTFISDYGGDPNSSGGWRFNIDTGGLTERYALLREQMRYDLNWQLRLSSSPSGEED